MLTKSERGKIPRTWALIRSKMGLDKLFFPEKKSEASRLFSLF